MMHTRRMDTKYKHLYTLPPLGKNSKNLLGLMPRVPAVPSPTVDFKTEVLFHLVDALYRQNHGLTVTSNFSLRDLVEHERMAPAIVRRLDDMCRVLEL